MSWQNKVSPTEPLTATSRNRLKIRVRGNIVKEFFLINADCRPVNPLNAIVIVVFAAFHWNRRESEFACLRSAEDGFLRGRHAVGKMSPRSIA